MTNHSSLGETPDAQAILNTLVTDYLREKKRKRVWQWLKRIVLSLVVLWGFYQMVGMHSEDKGARDKPHVGLIDIKGGIFDKDSTDADGFAKGLRQAYDNKELKALILRIDSPGGSPVQADYMYNAVRYYRKKFPDIKVYAVCVDICASAAYYVAASADDIYANPASLVGSIGVLYNGFGFVDAMQKLGVSRRLQTAGRNKGFRDQFSPVNPEQEQKLQAMLDIIHQQFIARVKAGRGDRLHADDDTFSGLFWTGEQARQMGLIDGFASSGQLAREVIKIDAIVDYTYQETVFEHMAKRVGTAMANQLPTALGLKPGIQ